MNERDEIERLREALIAVLADMPVIACNCLHHGKKDYHMAGPCPVETRLEAAVARARAVLKGGSDWKGKVDAETKRVGRKLTLDELLTLARTHDMTPEEIEAQRQSWARQDMD